MEGGQIAAAQVGGVHGKIYSIMKKNREPLVIGNWKMNPPTTNAAKRLFREIKNGVARAGAAPVVIAPPFVYLSELKKIQSGSKKVVLGSQDVFWERSGAYTGEISIPMLKDLSVTHVIIGHSERRARGVTDDEVNLCAKAVLAAGLTAVVCVGEKERDTHGNYLSFVEKQARAALSGISKAKLARLTIAYEPIWAIGTGATATPADVHEMKLFIQKVLTHVYGRNYASKIRILYGGSVHAKNAEELLREGEADGFLIGGASLKPDEFVDIVQIAKKHGG